jgi:hypothetical protein
MKGQSLFQKIDEALFRLVDQLKAQPAYLKFQETMGKLGEQEQKIINLCISYFIIALPIFAILSLWIMNSSMRSDIEDKQAVITEIQKFTQKHAQNNLMGAQTILQAPIAAQSELQMRLQQVMGRSQISNSSINLRSFDEFESAGNLRQFNAELTFDQLSTKQFTSFIKELEQRERIKISSMQVENLVSKSVLKGRLTLSFITQAAQ